ncbi:hypothetical protein BGZ67_008515 [Mortierella alpina]|nr:hypothetical protein BGZ67_008515 [Mortierella alpina]
MSTQGTRQGRLKAGTACVNCRKNKLRCSGSPQCERCVQNNIECVIDEALFLKANNTQSLYTSTGLKPSFTAASDSSRHHFLQYAPKPKKSPQQQQQQPPPPQPQMLLQSQGRDKQPQRQAEAQHRSQLHGEQAQQPQAQLPSQGPGQQTLKQLRWPEERRQQASQGQRQQPQSQQDQQWQLPKHQRKQQKKHEKKQQQQTPLTTNAQAKSRPHQWMTYRPQESDYVHSDSAQRSASRQQPRTATAWNDSGDLSGVRQAPLVSVPHDYAVPETSISPPPQLYSDQQQALLDNSFNTDDERDPGDESLHSGYEPAAIKTKPNVPTDQETIEPGAKRKNAGRVPESAQPDEVPPQESAPAVEMDEVEDFHIAFEKEQGEALRKAFSTMVLDGSGEQYVPCSLSSPLLSYKIPVVHLKDSDIWSVTLRTTVERDLPPKEVMDHLLHLYFYHVYPFAPLFIRKSFMEDYQKKRLDLQHIMILNAIFSIVCAYSDDPALQQDSGKYFNRAKVILDETYHHSRLSTVQALLLMNHYQMAHGALSAGFTYTAMAIGVAQGMGLHRADLLKHEADEAEVRNRVWWALYIFDRFGHSMLGRPLAIRDDACRVKLPSVDWIPEVIGDDTAEYPFESERMISLRLLWTVKLVKKLGQVVNTMYSIDAETDDNVLAELAKHKLPQLHNSLTSWYLALPKELTYTPYTMSPNSDQPPPRATAVMHMMYYTTMALLHRPYFRDILSHAIDEKLVTSSRNICIASVVNVSHFIDSLLLNGQLLDSTYYTFGCLLYAGFLFIQNASTHRHGSFEITRQNILKLVKGSHVIKRTFPMADTLTLMVLDILSSKTTSSEGREEALNDLSKFVAPLVDPASSPSVAISNMFESAKRNQTTTGLHHPYGTSSIQLQESLENVSKKDIARRWQNEITHAVTTAAANMGALDFGEESLLFEDPLDVPQDLRLESIDDMTIFEEECLVPSLVPSLAPSFGTADDVCVSYPNGFS